MHLLVFYEDILLFSLKTSQYCIGRLSLFFIGSIHNGGRDSSVGIATGYGLDGLGIESRWGRDFSHSPDRPWGPPSLLYNGYRVFPGGKAAGAWC
jgi:hypothetical protein